MNSYKKAGVDVEAGYEAVKLIKKQIKRTIKEGVLSDIGGFSGLFAINKKKYNKPVLVSGTDGVGTKLKIAFYLDKHDTIGRDCVAMCVNDVICCGADPLFFLDYIALGKNIPTKVANIVKGIADGCVFANCSLVGGETAEMPGFYKEDEYDIAGFAVGIVDKDKIIDGKNIKKGNGVIGIASSGLHSNGYSLVRKVFKVNNKKVLTEYYDELGMTLGEELLKPTKIYVSIINKIKDKYRVKAIAHITGGGFIENMPRMLPKKYGVKINRGTWPIQPIFKLIQTKGKITDRDMFNTFNMGIGMVMVVNKKDVKQILDMINKNKEKGYLIGEIIENNNQVKLD